MKDNNFVEKVNEVGNGKPLAIQYELQKFICDNNIHNCSLEELIQKIESEIVINPKFKRTGNIILHEFRIAIEYYENILKNYSIIVN